MPKTAKAKKKVSKPKTKVVNKPKSTSAKVVSKGPVKISEKKKNKTTKVTKKKKIIKTKKKKENLKDNNTDDNEINKVNKIDINNPDYVSEILRCEYNEGYNYGTFRIAIDRFALEIKSLDISYEALYLYKKNKS